MKRMRLAALSGMLLVVLLMGASVGSAQSILEPHEDVFEVKWDGSGRYLLSNGLKLRDNQYQLAGWNITALYQETNLDRPQFYLQLSSNDAFTSIEWLRSGEVLTGTSSGQVIMWQLDEQEGGPVDQVAAFDIHEDQILNIYYNPNRNGEFATLSLDGHLKMTNAFTGEIVLSVDLQQVFTDLHFMNRDLIWLVNQEGEFYSYRFSSQTLQPLAGLQTGVHDLDRRRELLVSAETTPGQQGVRVINFETQQVLHSFDLDFSPPVHLDLAGNADFIGICDRGSVWAFYKNGTDIFGNHVEVNDCTTISWDPSSQLLAVGDESGAVTVWNIPTGEIIKPNLIPTGQQNPDPVVDPVLLAISVGVLMILVVIYGLWRKQKIARKRLAEQSQNTESMLYPRLNNET